MKKAFLLIFSAVLIFASLISFSSCFYLNSGSPNSINYVRYDDAEKYSIGNFSYSGDGIEKIEIDWVSGEINVIQTGESVFSVFESGEDLEKSQQLHYMSDGKTLMIKYCKSHYSGIIDPEQKKLNIEIPKGIDLEINAVSADIFSGMLELNDISLSTVSGKSNLTKAYADELQISSVSGDIFVSYAMAHEDISLESVSGKITVEHADAKEIDVESVSGNVGLGISDVKDASIDTTSGNIELTLIGDCGITLDYSTTSGKFSADGDYSNGTRKCVVKASTVSGDLITKRSAVERNAFDFWG